ncbi:hypothetical protein F66182_4558 [Fusarium sp. NRRL 66182]|nr:hypothetical protein F66182_4558 [Fusarium sp. NRRL 66182]
MSGGEPHKGRYPPERYTAPILPSLPKLSKKKTEESDRHNARVLRDLKTTILVQIRLLSEKLEELLESLGVPKLPLFAETGVPAVSIREVRVWCMANTRSRRQSVEDPGLDEKGLIALMNRLSQLIDPRTATPDAHVTSQEVVNPDKTYMVTRTKTVDFIFPQVFFICSGIAFHENKPYTNEFHLVRQAARDACIGKADVESWKDLYDSLELLESDWDSVDPGSRHEMRRAVLMHLHNNDEGSSRPNPDLGHLSKPLRNCGRHHGLSFAKDDKTGLWRAVGCCYGCKIGIGYHESSTEEEVRRGIDSTIKQLDLGKRKVPHSCAEVISSKYCDLVGEE